MTDPAPQPRRTKRLTGWIGNLLLVLAVVVGVQWWQTRTFATGAAPPLVGETLDGQTINLKDLRGRPVLVHFWATWCPICKLGNGGIDAIAHDHRVLAVAMQSGGAAEVRRFMAERGLSFPVVLDPDGELARRWGVAGVPASFVLDPAGQIAYATMGASTEIGLRARLWAAGRSTVAPLAAPTSSKQEPLSAHEPN
ncbi:protein disulfide oxidoreductase [uncultured Thiodictyon sp.]|uniref:protein disulfide oxidoreductase n=1 Tax=uncultured Thiodictyon sp. TaxID=1846217 RepID=UPI0025D8AD21|nr:protein disulfide oxidoreductase [uncultured Thiodictyon sp.]